MEMEMETKMNVWSAVKPWTWDAQPPEVDSVFSISWSVQYRNSLWAWITRGTAVFASCAVILLAGNNIQELATNQTSYVLYFLCLNKI